MVRPNAPVRMGVTWTLEEDEMPSSSESTVPVVRNERPASSEGLSNVQESDWLQQKSLRNVPIPDSELAELS